MYIYEDISLSSSSNEKAVEKIKAYILCSITFFQKLCHLSDNVGKYDAARQATADNIIWCLCVACWITKATDTHSKYAILTAFPQQHWLCIHISMSHLYEGYPENKFCLRILLLQRCGHDGAQACRVFVFFVKARTQFADI